MGVAPGERRPSRRGYRRGRGRRRDHRVDDVGSRTRWALCAALCGGETA